MRWMIVLLIGIIVAGCGEGARKQQPYLVGQNPNGPYASAIAQKSEKVETARIEAESRETIAKINMQRDIEVQKLKNSADLSRANLTKEVAIEEVQTKKIALEKEHEYSTYLLIIIGAALVLLFLFLFYYTGNNRKARLKMHEDNLMLKLRLREQEMKMKVAEKMLDSITSGHLTPEQENRLIETLEQTTGRMIENKK